MRTGTLVVASVILLAGGATAQAPAASGNVTGTWAGSLESDDGNQTTARITLKADGRTVTGLVTGPQLTPGDVRGTFDARTGALAFTVSLQGTDTKFEFRGAIARDTLKVRATDGGRSYVLRATRATEDVAVRPPSQPVTPLDSAAAAVRRSFTEVRGWVSASANLVPADKYGYRPAGSVRTFGQVVAHIADAYTYYCGRAAGKNVEWSDAIEKGPNDKSTLLQKLDQSLAVCDAAYAGRGVIGPLVENVGHTSLHYGNLVTYIRMLGLVPPSS